MDKAQAMIKDDLTSWLTLHHLPSVSLAAKLTLIRRFGDATLALSAKSNELSEFLAEGGDDGCLSRKAHSRIKQDRDWLEQPEHHLLTFKDQRYPPLLREIPDPPLLLFVAGDVAVLKNAQISIVGSRNPSASGCDNARTFAAHLAEAGFTITSGMALGIDAVAHRGALAVGGTTIAVAACGLDQIYPHRHKELADQIMKSGAIVSEFSIGTPPRRNHFPRRNRLISGLSAGTLVVEAAKLSGSLITARLAANQGREVFAIPGPIHSSLSRGCNALIRDGAKLVENLQDILDELGHWTRPRAKSLEAMTVPTLKKTQDAPLLELIGYEPTSVDRLIERSRLTPDAVCTMLLKMELQGLIEACPGGTYIRTA
ncbi:MAG: DNA-processing protein DprA [Gammaproteobacteria bacterium]|nr:DNA-processing protein DprA [Gammaproteobacteria bacterium]